MKYRATQTQTVDGGRGLDRDIAYRRLIAAGKPAERREKTYGEEKWKAGAAEIEKG